MKFIHCADVHLDTPLQGLAEYTGAPVKEIRNATRRSFEKVLDTAIAEAVDFVIIAGDLYDTGLKSFESALFFNKAMSRLGEVGIDVYLIHGNHDAASKLIKDLRPPKNVKVFRSGEAHTFLKPELRVALHGQSFATPEITDNLAANYPQPKEGFFNIGILHTNLGGISEHANYAPCSLQSLKTKGYQYWALGHVHNRGILCADPYIVYPGNIQGRNGKEQGEKSCELVSVSETGVVTLTPISTSVVPWIETPIDASTCQTADDVYDRLRTTLGRLTLQNNERVTAVRIRISGTTAAHAELNRDPDQVRNETISIANESGNGLLWVERVQVATTPSIDRSSLLTREDPLGEIVRTADAVRRKPEALNAFSSVQELRNKLGVSLSEGTNPLEIDDALLSFALEEAEGLLLARLSAMEAQ